MRLIIATLALASCWTKPAPQNLHVDDRPLWKSGVDLHSACPLALRDELSHVRFAVFPTCAPMQFGEDSSYNCAGYCPTPCTFTRDGGRPIVPRYGSGLYVGYQQGNTENLVEYCSYVGKQLGSCTLANKTIESYSHDVPGRIDRVMRVAPDGGGTDVVTFLYEADRLATITRDNVAYVLAYDAKGRLTTETRTADDLKQTTVYEYGDNGRVSLVRTLDNSAAGESNRRELTYDGDELIKEVERGLTFERTSKYEYDRKGRPTWVFIATSELRDGEMLPPVKSERMWEYCLPNGKLDID